MVDWAVVLAPVMRDVTATCAVSLLVRYDQPPWLGEGPMIATDPTSVVGMTGLAVENDLEVIDQTVAVASQVASQVQDIAIEALWAAHRPLSWPECPHHRASHPLEPVLAGIRAVWHCPVTRVVVADIGALTAPS